MKNAVKNITNSNTSINDSKSSKEVNAMNNNTTTNAKVISNQSTQSEVKALSTEAAIILSQLMAEAQGDKNYKTLFPSKKYQKVLLTKKSNLWNFAKRTLPKASEGEVKNALNSLFTAGCMFYRPLDRGCLMGMRQQEWSRARELLLAAADTKDTPHKLTDKKITFEGDTPIGGNGVEPRELK